MNRCFTDKINYYVNRCYIYYSMVEYLYIKYTYTLYIIQYIYILSELGTILKKIYNRINYNYTLFSYNRFYYNYLTLPGRACSAFLDTFHPSFSIYNYFQKNLRYLLAKCILTLKLYVMKLLLKLSH